MRLFTTPASPWVRKCIVAADELGILGKIERVPTLWPHTWATQTVDFAPESIGATPVARIPALVTDDGVHLNDSFAICSYLNAELGDYRLMPAAGAQRWKLESIMSIANGLIEAQICRRAELLRKPGERSDDFIEKMRQREHRCYRAIEPLVGDFMGEVDLAQISVGVAASYNDFRFKEDWRAGNPKLAQWYERFIRRPSMQVTMPVETPQH